MDGDAWAVLRWPTLKPKRARRRPLFSVVATVSFVLLGFLFAGAEDPPAGSDLSPLTAMSLEQLGNLTVTSASKTPEQLWHTPAAIFVITRDDIRRSGATSVADVLRLAPGVEVAQIDSDKWAIGVRGFQGRLSRAVLVLIDGRSVYTPLFAGVYWEVQDTLLEDIDRIEVIRGPGGTVWGANAVDGVINIITRSSWESAGNMMAVGGGNVERGFLHVRSGADLGRFSYRVYGKAFGRSPQYHRDGRDFDAWQMGQGGFRVDWSTGLRDSVTIAGDTYGTVAGQMQGISTYVPAALTNVQGDGYFFGQNLLARWRRTFSSASDIQAQAYVDRTDRHELNFRERRTTLDLDFVHHLAVPRQQLVWGLGVRTSPSQYTQTVMTADFSPHHHTYNIFSGFAQNEVALVPGRLALTAGAKLEHNSFSGFELQPSGRLLWTPGAHQAVWGAVTRAVRTPSRVEDGFQFTSFALNSVLPVFTRLIGDGQFVSEKLYGYELGYRTLLGQAVYLDVAGYYNEHDDLLSVQAGSIFRENTPAPHFVLPLFFRNKVRAITKGVEVSPVWQLKTGVRLKGSYSFLRLDGGGVSVAPTVTQLEGGSPRHKLVVQGSFDMPKRFELDLAYRYVSALPDLRVAAYSTADVRFGWRPARHFELSIAGQNLLQPEHAEYGGDPGPLVGIKRSAYAKLTWTR